MPPDERANEFSEEATRDLSIAELSALFYELSPSSTWYEHLKNRLFSRCTGEVVDALNEASRKSSDLSNKIYWLNFFILLATIVAAVATAIQAYDNISKFFSN